MKELAGAISVVALLTLLAAATAPASAHTLTVMRVTPGKLAAGDTATVAAKFDFDRSACAVLVDFGDGTPPESAALTDPSPSLDAPLSIQHVYRDAGAYMVSIVPTPYRQLPKCAGGKHSTLIDVLDAADASDSAPK